MGCDRIENIVKNGNLTKQDITQARKKRKEVCNKNHIFNLGYGKNREKFFGKIKINGIYSYLGTFDTKLEAFVAHKIATRAKKKTDDINKIKKLIKIGLRHIKLWKKILQRNDKLKEIMVKNQII